MKKIYLLLISIFLFSCENNKEIIEDSNNLLIGNWSSVSYQNEELIFSRVQTLPNETYGISFKEDNFFTERTSGFCGTPPLTFFDRQGMWTLDTDALKIYDQFITYEVGAEPILWYNYQIVELTETQLILKRVITDQEKDHQKIMLLFDEIATLSYSVSCTNSNNWSFIGYGAKACGGSQGFIAYANQIDTTTFLQKVAKYTQAEKEYNFKWGIISDCSVPNEPESVACKNGFPSFNY
jgi:hypothetical protein